MEARAGGAGAAGAGAAAAAGAGDGASGGQCEHGIGSRVACRAAGVKPSVGLESGEEVAKSAICRSLLPMSLSFATLDPHRLCRFAVLVTVLRSLSYKNPSFLSLPKARGRSRTTPSGSALASTASLVGMVSGTHDGRDMRCVCSVGLRNKFLKCSKKTPNAHTDSCIHAIILQCSSWCCGFEGTDIQSVASD